MSYLLMQLGLIKVSGLQATRQATGGWGQEAAASVSKNKRPTYMVSYEVIIQRA